MNKNKVILTADNHIAQHKKSIKRLNDCIKSLEWVFKSAVEKNINNVIIAGDLFHDREKIDIIAHHLTFDIIYNYCNNKGIKLYLLLGNHDLWYYEKWDIHSVRSFSAIPNVTIIDKPETIRIDDVNVDFLPFTHDPIKYLKDLNSKILIGHLAIDGAKLNSNNYSDVVIEHDGDMVRVDSDLFSKWNKIFLGHYHACQKIKNIEYIGSPLELTWGEINQEKHIIEFDLVGYNQSYIINDFSPKHLVANYNKIDSFDLKNNFVKIYIANTHTDEALNIRKEIEKKDPYSLDIVINNDSSEHEHFIEDAKSILYDEDKMLEEYINSVNLDKKIDKIKLLEIGKKICRGFNEIKKN